MGITNVAIAPAIPFADVSLSTQQTPRPNVWYVKPVSACRDSEPAPISRGGIRLPTQERGRFLKSAAIPAESKKGGLTPLRKSFICRSIMLYPSFLMEAMADDHHFGPATKNKLRLKHSRTVSERRSVLAIRCSGERYLSLELPKKW